MVTDEEIARAAAELREAESMSPPPALVILSSRFGLSRFEQEILLLCAALELDTRIPSLCARAQDDRNRSSATFALAMALFDEPAWDALSPEGPLRRWRLIEINQPGAQPLATSALRADERIVNFVKGLNYLDDRLAPLLSPAMLEGMDAALPGSQALIVEIILNQLKQPGRVPLIQLVGADVPAGWSRRTSPRKSVWSLPLPVESIPPMPASGNTGDLIEREMALWPFALYLDVHDLDKSDATDLKLSRSTAFLARSNGVLFSTRRRFGAGHSPVHHVRRRACRHSRTARAWAESRAMTAMAFGALGEPIRLKPTAIWSIGKASFDENQSRTSRSPNDCGVPVYWRSAPAECPGQRIDARATWNDIVRLKRSEAAPPDCRAVNTAAGSIRLGFRPPCANARLSINALLP